MFFVYFVVKHLTLTWVRCHLVLSICIISSPNGLRIPRLQCRNSVLNGSRFLLLSFLLLACFVVLLSGCIISLPGNDSFWEGLCFAGIYSFFPRVISELHWLISTKFYTMLRAAFNFIIPLQNFEGASPKNYYYSCVNRVVN